LGDTPENLPALGVNDLALSEVQIKQLDVLYPALGNIEKCLEQLGVGKRYFKHASWIVKQHGLKRRA